MLRQGAFVGFVESKAHAKALSDGRHGRRVGHLGAFSEPCRLARAVADGEPAGGVERGDVRARGGLPVAEPAARVPAGRHGEPLLPQVAAGGRARGGERRPPEAVPKGEGPPRGAFSRDPGLPERQGGKGGSRGYDGGKRLKGRKRFVAVDAHGHLLSVSVVPASVAEPTGGKALLHDLSGGPRMRKALVDGGCGHGPGSPIAGLGRELGIEVEVVESLKGSGFRLQARRWVVERTFAWLVRCRRLRVDYEERARTTVAWVQAAMVRLMVRRLARAT